MEISPNVKHFKIASDSISISGNMQLSEDEVKLQVLDKTLFEDDDNCTLFMGQWDISIEDEKVGHAYLKTREQFAHEAFIELDEGYEDLFERPLMSMADEASQYVLVTPREYNFGYCNTNPVFINFFGGKNSAAKSEGNFRLCGFHAADLFFALHKNGVFDNYGFPRASQSAPVVYACVYPD